MKSSALALVVTADDFGIGRATSEGILEAHFRGPVTATSLMVVTGDHVRQSLSLLENAPSLDVGLHVVLTRCGHPPLVARRSSGLVDRDGQFHGNGKLWMKSFLGQLNQSAVAEEIAAQAELFHRLLGRPPSHVDAHHHSHQLPVIRDALLDVIGQALLPAIVRTTIEPPKVRREVHFAKSKRFAAHYLGRRTTRLFRQSHIWTNDFFIGMLPAGETDHKTAWQKYLSNLPPAGVVEWIVHPGKPDESLAGRDDYQAQRVRELEILTQPDEAAWTALRPLLSRKSQLAGTHSS
jgi:hypothetical protein